MPEFEVNVLEILKAILEEMKTARKERAAIRAETEQDCQKILSKKHNEIETLTRRYDSRS